jgi:hypothetical protein
MHTSASVIGRRRDYVGITASAPQITAESLHGTRSSASGHFRTRAPQQEHRAPAAICLCAVDKTDSDKRQQCQALLRQRREIRSIGSLQSSSWQLPEILTRPSALTLAPQHIGQLPDHSRQGTPTRAILCCEPALRSCHRYSTDRPMNSRRLIASPEPEDGTPKGGCCTLQQPPRRMSLSVAARCRR